MSWPSRTTRNRRLRLPEALPKVLLVPPAWGIYLQIIELEKRETTLIEVVQSLGEYINDEDGKIRDRAVSYLTAIISTVPPTFLTRQQIDVLCDFLCARIEDAAAIEGLSKLQSLDRFTNIMTQTVVKA
jgi:DNA repair/transcription protein MET18/MMS19